MHARPRRVLTEPLMAASGGRVRAAEGAGIFKGKLACHAGEQSVAPKSARAA